MYVYNHCSFFLICRFAYAKLFQINFPIQHTILTLTDFVETDFPASELAGEGQSASPPPDDSTSRPSSRPTSRQRRQHFLGEYESLRERQQQQQRHESHITYAREKHEAEMSYAREKHEAEMKLIELKTLEVEEKRHGFKRKQAMWEEEHHETMQSLGKFNVGLTKALEKLAGCVRQLEYATNIIDNLEQQVEDD